MIDITSNVSIIWLKSLIIAIRYVVQVIAVSTGSEQMAYVHRIELDGLLFSQCDCNLYLRAPDSRNLFALVDGLLTGQILAEDFHLTVCRIDGFFWCLDHRRLVALKLYKYIGRHCCIFLNVNVRSLESLSDWDLVKLKQLAIGAPGTTIYVSYHWMPNGLGLYKLLDTHNLSSMRSWEHWFSSRQWWLYAQ